MSAIDEFLLHVEAPQREVLTHIRQTVVRVVPDAEEVISYNMPGFKYKGKYLVTFNAFKHHMSIFPGASPVAELRKELEPFMTSKGTIQFTLDNQLPEAVLVDIIKSCVARIDER